VHYQVYVIGHDACDENNVPDAVEVLDALDDDVSLCRLQFALSQAPRHEIVGPVRLPMGEISPGHVQTVPAFHDWIVVG
jgi:hypothetical protein